jgi:hypothetical protein
MAFVGTRFARLFLGYKRMKRLLSILFMLAALAVLSYEGRTEPLRIGENLRHENVLLPNGTPDKDQLVITDYAKVHEEAEGSGIIVFYDDPQTKLEVDYLELYDIDGDLLLVSWIDRFGVCQIAIDRALLDEDRVSVDRVLVLITDGTQL